MEKFMKIALGLAAEYKGRTSPNPMVGAVVVKDSIIVGKGAHQKAGEPHAEVIALDAAGSQAESATLYVTLEPCAHFGKTPPCVHKIVASKIKKVVATMQDPNPLCRGKGFDYLRKHGVEVVTNICREEAARLNEVFIHYMTTQRPWVTLKAAITLDGKIATQTGDSKWISNSRSRQKVHTLRGEHDAVLIGENTFKIDNPRLNVRLENLLLPNPQKVIITPELNITPRELEKSNAFRLSDKDKQLILVCWNDMMNTARHKKIENMGVHIIGIPYDKDGILDMDFLLKELAEMSITCILLEGGNQVYTHFVRAGLVNKAYFFIAPKILGESGLSWLGEMPPVQISCAESLRDVSIEQLDDNVLITGYMGGSACSRES